MERVVFHDAETARSSAGQMLTPVFTPLPLSDSFIEIDRVRDSPRAKNLFSEGMAVYDPVSPLPSSWSQRQGHNLVSVWVEGMW